MTVLSWVFVGLVAVTLALAGYTAIRTSALEARYPPLGERLTVDGVRVHLLRIPARAPTAGPGKPPFLLFHGASGSMRDMMQGFAEDLATDRDVILVDRPGLGWTERGLGEGRRNPDWPLGQAALAATLLDALGVQQVIAVGHSFGASVAVSFALDFPERTAGLVALAPATHPWPGGIAWHNHVASLPVIGPLFVHTLVMPVGEAAIPAAIANVFAPNPAPAGYADVTGAAMILTPSRFRANASDLTALYEFVLAQSPRYGDIKAPTLIVTGDADQVVWPSLHSRGLERQIDGARLVTLEGVGHMPQHSARDVVVGAIQRFAAETGQTGNGNVVGTAGQ